MNIYKYSIYYKNYLLKVFAILKNKKQKYICILYKSLLYDENIRK